MSDDQSTEQTEAIDDPTAPDVLSDAAADILRQLVAKNRAQEQEPAEPEPKAEPATEPTPAEPDAAAEPEAEDKLDPKALFERAKAIEDQQRAERDLWKQELETARELQTALAGLDGDPVGSLEVVLRKALGPDATDEQVSQLWSTVYENLTTRVLGLESDSPESKATKQVSQIRRELAELKQEKEAERKRQEAEAKRAEADQYKAQAVNNFSQMLEHNADKFPWLMAEENPGEIVYGFAKMAIDAGEDITVEQAASIINKRIEQRAKRFAHLLAPNGSQQTKPADAAKPRSDTGSVTLTNEAASAVPTTPPESHDYDGDDEAHLEATLAKLRKRIVKKG